MRNWGKSIATNFTQRLSAAFPVKSCALQLGPTLQPAFEAGFGEVEAQASSQRRGLEQTHRHDVAKLVHGVGALSHQRVSAFVMAKILAAQGANGKQAFGTTLPQPEKEPEACDAGDARVECLADPIFHESRDITIGRITLCSHRAPLSPGDVI